MRIKYRLNGISISKLTSTVFKIKCSILQQENTLNESSCGVIFIYYDDIMMMILQVCKTSLNAQVGNIAQQNNKSKC